MNDTLQDCLWDIANAYTYDLEAESLIREIMMLRAVELLTNAQKYVFVNALLSEIQDETATAHDVLTDESRNDAIERLTNLLPEYNKRS